MVAQVSTICRVIIMFVQPKKLIKFIVGPLLQYKRKRVRKEEKVKRLTCK